MDPPRRTVSARGVAPGNDASGVGPHTVGIPAVGNDVGARGTGAHGRGPFVPLWLALLGVLVTVAISFDVCYHGPLTSVDTHLSDQMLQWGLRFKRWPRRLLTPGLWFGQRGTVLTGSLLLAFWTAWRWRSVEPLVRLIVAVVGLGVVVYSFKLGLARNAPIAVARGQRVATGASFPSGHTANAVVLWGLAQYTASHPRLDSRLVDAVRVGRLVAPVVVSVVMVLLDYHWLTDLLAGVAVGVVLLWATLHPCWNHASEWIDSRSFRRSVADSAS